MYFDWNATDETYAVRIEGQEVFKMPWKFKSY